MRTILHCDLNNFYASVECLYQPKIRSRPVAVCGDPALRHGIVLAKNYLAKGAGVKTGDAIWQAREKCPGLVCVTPHFSRYLTYSRLARRLYEEYTDRVEPFGLDECWLDLTGCEHLFGSGQAVADALRRRIREELGVTASVGVSFNKIFAKLGSDYKKPDATTVITPDNFKEIVWPLPVDQLLYVGRATRRKLNRLQIRTIGDLAQTGLPFLSANLGKMGATIWCWANGYDNAPVRMAGTECDIKSIGNGTTAPRDLVTESDVKITLRALCESVGFRLRQRRLLCSTVQIGLRDNALFYFERQGQLEAPTCLTDELFDKAFALYRRNKPHSPLRSVTVRACKLSSWEEQQLSLFRDDVGRMRLDATVDDLRRRFGNKSLQRGLMLEDAQLAAVDPAAQVIHPVSYFGG